MKQRLLHAVTGLALLGLTACAGASSEAASPKSPAMEPGVSGDYAAGAPAMAPESMSVTASDSASPEPPAERAISFKSEEASGSRDQSLGFAGVAKAPAPQAPPAPPPVAKPTTTPMPGETSTKPVAGEVAAMRAPLLVYTAQITVAVFEVAASLAQVEDLGRELGGFLARRNDSSITIRIPSARFDEAVKRLEKVGDMLHRNVTAEDVTEEFRDLEVRLRSAHAVQERLTQLLAKAVKVEESVMIERELDRVTGEIDRIEGRMKFLRDRAAFSTITVTFSSKSKESLSQGPFRLPSPWLQQLGLGRLLQL
ncbi:MAG: DUF4349 domain-containing protein [Byssovorax sp.]